MRMAGALERHRLTGVELRRTPVVTTTGTRRTPTHPFEEASHGHIDRQQDAPRTRIRTGARMASDIWAERQARMRCTPAAHSLPPSDGSQPAGVNHNLRWARRVLAWNALMAIAVVLALLVQALAASALVAPGPAVLPAACQAALAAGDNERESFLAHLCDGAISATAKSTTLDDPKKIIVRFGFRTAPLAGRHPCTSPARTVRPSDGFFLINDFRVARRRSGYPRDGAGPQARHASELLLYLCLDVLAGRRESGTGAPQGLGCGHSDTVKLDAAKSGSLIRRVD